MEGFILSVFVFYTRFFGMSFIRYKFKSANYYDEVHCEGHGMAVWELKDEIISAKRLGRLYDFDLVLSNDQTREGKRPQFPAGLIRSFLLRIH